MVKKVYVVRLPEEERQQLESMVKGEKAKGRRVSALKLTTYFPQVPLDSILHLRNGRQACCSMSE
jgi:hypothetical protein